MEKYVMALDQGTTSSRCILFDHAGRIASIAQMEFTQYYPQPGWVEHDAMEIWSSQYGVAMEAMAKLGVTADNIAAIGITNQRETTIVWERATGKPICHAIVWQCRRTAQMVDAVKAAGYGDMIREKTGLVPDAYFSASKIAWILENIPGAMERAQNGELMFGNVDTWLIYNLSGKRLHVTDYTNASRTMLFNIHTLEWDDELLDLFEVPKCMLPKVVPSSAIYGMTDKLILGGEMVGSLESSVYADSEVNFAILPYPKLDDMQKDYISPIHDTAEIGFIPATLSIENLQVASAVIEALSRETVNTVIPDYYESTLKIRYARESANAEMLELIHDHYNSAFVVAWTVSVNNYFLEGIYSSVYQNSNTFTSYCRMYESAAQEKLRELIFNQELVIEQMENQYGKLTN